MDKPVAVRVAPVEVVLLDGYGTLLDLPDPVPRLQRLLTRAGHRHDTARVAAALRAEIAFYRLNHVRGRDAASLAALREECAAVLRDGLDGDAPPPDRLAPLLVESLRFRLFPDALPALDALRAAGVRLGVVSNWDCGLDGLLAELGIADRFAVVATSAEAGAAKPDPAIFRHALARLGAPAHAALHCGDLPDTDCLGATRAGVAAVIVDRRGELPDGPCPRIPSLRYLMGLLGR